MIILHILLFVLCLSILVVIHELGHLAAAKIFKVYCFEFSVGFGPAFFRKKRKKGETYVALRCIPFGGYVSMYGENEEEEQQLPDGIESIPKERSLSAQKKWKKAIVMGAGVFLNAVLAFVLFFVSNSCFEQKQLVIPYLEVTPGSVAANQGLVSEEDNPATILFYGCDDLTNLSPEATIAQENGYYIITKGGEFLYEDSTTVKVAVLIDVSRATFSTRDYVDLFRFFPLNNDGTINYVSEEEIIVSESEKVIDSLSFDLRSGDYGEDNKVITSDLKTYNFTLDVIKDNDKYQLEQLGIKMYLNRYWNNIGEAFKKSGEDFGESSVLIFKALGGLFIGENWDSVGGPIAIFTQTTSTLENFGVAYFIQMWAIISVNLAIFNLIPFPGLDGWHLLVIAVEAITRKKMPAKAKNIASLVGMILLFGLMILIVIKDVIGLF